MAGARSPSVTRLVGAVFSNGTLAALSDGELLHHFTSRSGESAERAFAILVERHGPLVLRVCRLQIADTHIADDAFQATFMVLARRARAIRNPELLANWLYGVAVRTARKARGREVRRLRREAGEDAMRGLELTGREAPQDLAFANHEEAALVHDALERLPQQHRSVIVLCCLEGLTLEEAARRLHCSHGAVRGRLAKARAQLRRNLARRGLVVPAGVVVAALSADAASASVPVLLRDQTLRAVAAFAASSLAGTSASSNAMELAASVSRAMTVAPLKAAAAVTIGLVALIALALPLLRASLPHGPGVAPAGVERSQPPEQRLIEKFEWYIAAIDRARGTITLDDRPGLGGGSTVALVWSDRHDRLISSGLTLDDLMIRPGTRVWIGGNASGVDALQPGMRVSVRLDQGQLMIDEIRSVSGETVPQVYVLDSIDPDRRTVTVTVRENRLTLERIAVANDANVMLLHGEPDGPVSTQVIGLADLRPGSRVSLTFRPNAAGRFVVTSIKSGGTSRPKERTQ